MPRNKLATFSVFSRIASGLSITGLALALSTGLGTAGTLSLGSAVQFDGGSDVMPLRGGTGAPLLTAGRGALALTPVLPLGAALGRRSGPGQRCTEDRKHCIALTSYVADVCRTIEATAREAGLDPHYFSRLIWQESLFDATAVSHAGAQGIAQFMPATARERGLSDPFNPAEALRHSARLLKDLEARFGNLGLAAAAYNGGPGRVSKFVSGRSGLPRETRHYVKVITGHTATDWRDKRPRPDYRLAGGTPFQAACRSRAAGREIAAFETAN